MSLTVRSCRWCRKEWGVTEKENGPAFQLGENTPQCCSKSFYGIWYSFGLNINVQSFLDCVACSLKRLQLGKHFSDVRLWWGYTLPSSSLCQSTLKRRSPSICFFSSLSLSTILKSQKVKSVNTYKYLGTIIDSKLNFEANCEVVCKKEQQSLFCLRKQSSLNIDRTMMTLFYLLFLSLTLTLTEHSNRSCLNQVVKWSSKLFGESQRHPAFLYTYQSQRMAGSILNYDSQTLNAEFKLLPSGWRLSTST